MFFSRFLTMPVLGLAGGLGLGLVPVSPGFAQTPSPSPSLPTCASPQTNEFLVIVVTDTQEQQRQIANQVQRSLGPQYGVQVCQYRGKTISRVSGFRDVEAAKKWAIAVDLATGLPGIIVTPLDAPNPAAVTFKPQVMGNGYAVLVDYLNNPGLAQSLRQRTQREVGLVSYQSNPYLLALQTSSPTEAQTLLQNLGENGFLAVMVPSNQVWILTTKVRY